MTKDELLKEILYFLRDNPKTQLSVIRENVNDVLRRKGITGIKEEHIGGAIRTTNVRVSDETALKINDIIYDLLYKERVITPGFNASNLELPWLHVSDMEKLVKLSSD